MALVGVDGSGKSTVARLLSSPDRVVLSCLRPHENPDGPLHELSRHLDTLSRDADESGSPELKLAVLYLQMCTYGSVERFFIDEWAAQTMVSERHPLIDALVYLPLYRDAIRQVAGPGRDAILRGRLTRSAPEARQAVSAWCRVLGRRNGGAPRLDTLAAELVDLLNVSVDERVEELSARFAVSPPDLAILLELDVGEAVRRIAARNRRPEPHERHDLLARVHAGYESALAALTTVRVHRVAVDGRSPAEVATEVSRLVME
ncbi:hypothetical protein [Streptosporangium sp. NPDC002721]|uniref:hypothetical protein n=1 Tax=Streptosporangium sp. NPDC002721 TaxID=3366188 RepID=UPI0036CF9072